MNKSSAIAVVGMAGRFPGARNLTEFWRNLRNGVEVIRPFSDAELLAAGVSHEELENPEYVKSGVLLEDVDRFDAAFFGFSPRDASIMDPQHRLFLECAWEALENAGHVPGEFAGSIGVYAGSGMNAYMIHNLLTNAVLVESAGLFLIRQTGNDKDVLATRVSYELNLQGPSINVQTACSTSLVAVHLACQSLLNQECDMALAGGVTIEFPHGRGYVYREGEILSRDGHCRAFDAEASGTVFSSGGGIVVLRRLADALADRDTIHAVILGSAINNDGARKAGYLAPSVEGQAEVIAEALGVAGVEPRDISYVETHGTGTRVGDPIEIKALTKAFGGEGAGRNCAIGSLKASIGHLDAAAGVAGLIKTVLSLEHREIPASLHFRQANPLIDFAHSPFYVNAELAEWKATRGPRRAGVTSLGIGGTNAHVILEEAPIVPDTPEGTGGDKRHELLVMSAKTTSALERLGENLCSYLEENPRVALKDIAHTSQVGRKALTHRRVVVAGNNEEALRLLKKAEVGRVFSGQVSPKTLSAVFLFSGQGSQYVNMGRELYQTEPVFRAAIDLCSQNLLPELGLDLRGLLYPGDEEASEAAEKLSRTRYTQPGLFAIEYALAQWWIAHGVEPAAMLGHSIGEYVAACLAGVFTVEEGLHVTAVRGRLMDEMPRGSMLSVSVSAEELRIPTELSLAVVNGPTQCVVSGPSEAVQTFAKELEKKGVTCRTLHTSHAFHSSMMDPMLETFRGEIEEVSLRAPKIPYISNLTGTWITAEEATTPDYWSKHLRSAVQFSRGLSELFGDGSRAYLEVGPGQVLTSLTRQHAARPKMARVFASMRHPQEQISDAAFLLGTMGQLWIAGCSIEWKKLHGDETPRRIPLPTYPFERQRFWIEPGSGFLGEKPRAVAPESEKPKADSWFHERAWRRAPLARAAALEASSWLVFLDEMGLGAEICNQLRTAGHEVVQVSAGSAYARQGAGRYVVRAGARKDYDHLLEDIAKNEQLPKRVLHLWAIRGEKAEVPLDRALDLSFYGPLFLAQVLGEHDALAVEITTVSNGLQSVAGENVMAAERAAMFGPIRVLPKEFPGTTCRSIDVDWKLADLKKTAGEIIAECGIRDGNSCVAWRHSERWVEEIAPVNLAALPAGTRLKEKGVYWITGGLGGIGLSIAEELAKTVHARLVLSGRTPLPARAGWDALLAESENADGLRQTLRKLREIESLGGEVLTIAADVADRQQMEEAVRGIRKRFGELNGVIHAAGLIEDGPLQTKTAESAARVLAPKIQGTLVLKEVLRDCKLDFLLLFSSVSAVDAPAGQVDYAGANAFLDTLAMSQSEYPITAVNWSLWNDVGMGVRNAAGRDAIVGRRLFQSEAETVYSTRVSFQGNWWLREHRLTSGKALLPGTGHLQLAAAGLLHERFESGVMFEDVFFLAPLSVEPGGSKEVRLRMKRQRGGFRFSILAKEKEWTEYASGFVQRNTKSRPAEQSLAEIRRRCSGRSIRFDDEHRTRQEKYFEFGRRWRNLRVMDCGKQEALAELELGTEFQSDLEAYPLHPALLDLATGSSLYLIKGYEESEALYLPLSYKRAVFYRPLSARVYSHIRAHQENTALREIATFDFTLLDAEGGVVAEIEEFSLRRIAAQGDGTALALRPQTAAISADLAEAVAEKGISTAEGLKALEQILSSQRMRNIIVMRGERGERPKKAVAAAAGKTASSGKSEIEDSLAEWWQELLGVEKVGLDDDFFDLGGHSLIAVRLFSKIKKTFRLELGLSTLFEARTVRQLAALIRQAGGAIAEEKATSTAVVAIRAKGSRLPLFLTSGLGGEVIGFHTLTQCLGEDQPVYALQPPGLDGKEPLLSRVEDMAAYYIREIRKFQPHGPYCLAGYSFGGYVVFEMAQQLHAASEQVALLGFLDTIEWRYLERLARSADFRQRWGVRLDRIRERPWDYIKEKAMVRLNMLAEHVFEKIGRPLPEGISPLEKSNREAMSQYRPKVYPGKLTIFRSVTRGATIENDELLGWGGLVSGGIEVKDVTGGHLDMLNEPNVRVLADKMRGCLDNVQPAERGDSSTHAPDESLQPAPILN
ncbi:MAG: SDR family NAD(P)-dependent oxidoreductase [Candidatus Acidiferrum sp.]